MKRLGNNPLALTGLALCLCVAGLLAFFRVYAAPPPATIHACYNNTNGNLRLVSSASDCREHETAISWNEQGPQGPPGPGGNLTTFRHTRTVANICGPGSNFSFIDNAAINGPQRNDLCHSYRWYRERWLEYQSEFKLVSDLHGALGFRNVPGEPLDHSRRRC